MSKSQPAVHRAYVPLRMQRSQTCSCCGSGLTERWHLLHLTFLRLDLRWRSPLRAERQARGSELVAVAASDQRRRRGGACAAHLSPSPFLDFFVRVGDGALSAFAESAGAAAAAAGLACSSDPAAGVSDAAPSAIAGCSGAPRSAAAAPEALSLRSATTPVQPLPGTLPTLYSLNW